MSAPKLSEAMRSTELMLTIHKALEEEKGLAGSTISAYMRVLWVLNKKKPFNTMAFINNTESIMNHITTDYAESTQKTILGSICSILSLKMFQQTPQQKKVYAFYQNKMNEKVKEADAKDTSEMSDKQAENWMTWKEVESKLSELKEVLKLNTNKELTPSQWNSLTALTILALYVYAPPRRNQDYLLMVIHRLTKKETPTTLPTDKNYLIVDASMKPEKFVFNKYKTSKTFGTQTQDVPSQDGKNLSEILQMYFKFHPLINKKGNDFPFLVDSMGEPFKVGNAITRVLNKIFGKKVGSSMLRHIYLSDKYSITEMSEDAQKMAHSVAQQKEYLKKSPESQLSSPTPASGPSTQETHPQSPPSSPPQETPAETPSAPPKRRGRKPRTSA